jgi:hypothetical protein
MSTCDHCGATIDWRIVDGRRVPIHPGGGWHCGGASSSGGGMSTGSRIRTFTDWSKVEFTRPTRCGECGQDVFFIRHNGGSFWVDELGWPWPKHPCYYDEDDCHARFVTWATPTSNRKNLRLGIVLSYRTVPRSNEAILEIRLDDESRCSVVLARCPKQPEMLGTLVLLSVEDLVIIFPADGEISLRGLVTLPIRVGKSSAYRCPRCNAFVLASQAENHLGGCSGGSPSPPH